MTGNRSSLSLSSYESIPPNMKLLLLLCLLYSICQNTIHEISLFQSTFAELCISPHCPKIKRVLFQVQSFLGSIC